MGVLKHLLFWPVTGPAFLTRFSLEKVEGAVRSELTDDSSVKRDLLELQMRLELGDIDEATYLEREAELMARLRSVRTWRERYGMPMAGGLVQVSESGSGTEAGPEPASGDQAAEVDVRLGFDD